MHSTILNNQKFTSKKKKNSRKNKTDFLFPLNTIKTKPTSLNRAILDQDQDQPRTHTRPRGEIEFSLQFPARTVSEQTTRAQPLMDIF